MTDPVDEGGVRLLAPTRIDRPTPVLMMSATRISAVWIACRRIRPIKEEFAEHVNPPLTALLGETAVLDAA